MNNSGKNNNNVLVHQADSSINIEDDHAVKAQHEKIETAHKIAENHVRLVAIILSQPLNLEIKNKDIDLKFDNPSIVATK